jgi:hypothetical protein
MIQMRNGNDTMVVALANSEITPKQITTESENPYGYEVGQTVKLDNGQQGRVIDIFDDSIEVLLVGGRTVTVDFRDAHVIDEDVVAEDQLDELKCWPGYTRVRGVPAGAPGSCKKKTNEEGVAEGQEEKCPHCGGAMFSEMIMNEKKDACYYKVKSRYKVWPSAYASGALVKCRKSGADSWGDGGKKSESAIMRGLVDEGWKEKLGAAALAGSMALGAAGANARVVPGQDDPSINRLTGKPIATQQATDTAPTKAGAPSGYSKEWLQKAADPNRIGRYMISVEKAQELLKNMP